MSNLVRELNYQENINLQLKMVNKNKIRNNKRNWKKVKIFGETYVIDPYRVALYDAIMDFVCIMSVFIVGWLGMVLMACMM